MKKVPNEATVKVIALRHQNNMEKIAVKKFTQFPVKLDDVVRNLFKDLTGGKIYALAKFPLETNVLDFPATQ